MTFRDILNHSAICVFLCMGCWAPEVQPPTQKKSPAELAGLAIPSAEASTDTNSLIPPQELLRQNAPPTQTNLTQTDAPPPETYPFIATLTATSADLLGHGGGTILTISETDMLNAEIEVLEHKDEFYRVLCKKCSPSHPFQAGWIHQDDVQRNN